jgi:hypothetical protein
MQTYTNPTEITITETQVKKMINDLIDLKADNTVDFEEASLSMRNHGLNMAIIRLKVRFLSDWNTTDLDTKYDVSEQLNQEAAA